MSDDAHNATTQPSQIEGQSHRTGEQGVSDSWRESRLAEITADIRRLQDAAARAKRPWYQSAPVLISLAAVLVSTTLTVLTIGMEETRIKHRERAQRLERLQQTVLELHNVSKSMTLELSRIQDPQAQKAAGSFLLAQRHLLSEEAFDLVAEVGVVAVPSSVLSSIGYQLAQDMEFTKAEELYEAVIDRDDSKNTQARRVALAGLGDLYMAPAAKRFDRFDPDKGRASWESLLADIGGGDDSMSLFLRADALSRWAAGELNSGLADNAREPNEAATERGRRLLAKAKEVANKLMANDRNRASLLMQVAAIEVQLGTTDVDYFAYDTVLAGVCELRFLDNPVRRTDCVLTVGAGSPNFQIHVTEYGPDGRVGANLAGALNLLDPTTAQIQWQRTVRTGNPMQPLLMTQGQTILHRVGTEARYRGQRPDLMTGGAEDVEYYFPAHAKMMGSNVAIASREVAEPVGP